MAQDSNPAAGVAEVKFRDNSDMAADWVNGKLHHWFRDGTSIVFDPALASNACNDKARQYGWEVRFNRFTALERKNFPDGKIPMAARKDAILRGRDHYHSGSTEWELPSKGGSSGPDAGTIVLAISRVFSKDTDGANAMVEGLAAKRNIDRDAALAIWAASDKIKAAIVQIRAERASKDASIDADALAAELEAGGAGE